jgi:hypothetical protein
LAMPEFLESFRFLVALLVAQDYLVN